ncbi:carboxylating nicotinate-nucleotide diphosphorylase [Caloramator proteoclasticus]|uniref:Probable nicotinate-nucleotide pyrophosphorylase [carboxylating] n=1 Tax=Caloramator proteoclasticus DSM 10124 TaxID=1121262 RepID=A0A1M4Y3D7_9CLOT|nr:carboxylating nicotinate-nucleotide diphosphorylase [Caloramator proteoclasticus]SHE99992.1 nicotinate-nucleotide pyrophosphorylase [carboxylating] [Caloramator proteoclasticus DSM 10124]
MNLFEIDEIIKKALNEDINYIDLTTEAIIDKNMKSTAKLIAKQDGIIAGTFVFKRVFDILGDVVCTTNFEDGSLIKSGDVVCTLYGSTQNILIGERTALNFIQRMSGIATTTWQFVKKLEGTKTKLLDTRKTTPTLRILEKYSTSIGGAMNHRFNLSDGILIKDNHIKAAGSIKRAVDMVSSKYGYLKKIEVETETIDMVKECLECNVDIIMLDNMNIEDIKKAVSIINGKALIEVSGNVNLENIREVAEANVDFISTGYITHSYKSLDLSLKIV